MNGAVRNFAICFMCMAISNCGNLIPRAQTEIDPASYPKGNFKLDPDHASVTWKIDHLGYSTMLGRFNSIEAELEFDAEKPEQAKLRVTIEAASLDSGVDALDELLRGPDWFDVARFPKIEFVAQSIVVEGERTGRIDGILTLHGVSRPQSLEAELVGSGNDFLRGGAQILGFKAEAIIQRSAFGVDYLVPAIGDEVSIEIHAEFVEAD